MKRATWRAMVPGVAKSQTRLSELTNTFISIWYFNTLSCFLTTSDKGRHIPAPFPSMVWLLKKLLKKFFKNSLSVIPVGGCNELLLRQTSVSVVTCSWLPRGSLSSVWTGKKEGSLCSIISFSSLKHREVWSLIPCPATIYKSLLIFRFLF